MKLLIVVLGVLTSVNAVLFKRAFLIPSAAMRPALVPHERVLVWRSFSSDPPKPGDIVAFVAPPWVGKNAGEPWIKRVIAVEGQRVRRDEETFIVDDKPLALGPARDDLYLDVDEATNTEHWVDVSARVETIGDVTHVVYTDRPPFTGSWPWPGSPRADEHGLECDDAACTVQPGYGFVVGDNRDHSSDGRVWGAVPKENVIGRITFVWFPRPHALD